MAKKVPESEKDEIVTELKSKKKKGAADKKQPEDASKEEIFQDYKYQVYQQAVERVYKKGKISPNEEMVLESMRDTLEIPYEMHEKIIKIIDSAQEPTEPKEKPKEKIDKVEKKAETADTELPPMEPEEVKEPEIKPKPIKKTDKIDRVKKISESFKQLDSSIDIEKISETVEVDTDAQRLNPYKKALELTLVDGLITQKEWTILSGLREALGISTEEHDKLEKEVRERLQKELEMKRFEAERAEKRKIAAYRDGEDKIIALEKQVKKAAKTGIDITETLKYIDQAREDLESNKYREVNKSITEAKKSLLQAKKVKTANTKIVRLEQMFEKAEKLGVKTKTAQEMIDECRSALAASEFKTLNAQATKTRTLLQNLLKGKGSLEQIRKTEALLLKVKKKNVDCTEIEDIIADARKELELGNYAKIAKQMTQARIKMRDLERLKKSKELIDKIVSAIETAQTQDIEVVEAEKLLKKANEALKSKKFTKVQQIIKDIKAALREAEKIKEITDLISEVELIIQDVRDMGAKVTNAEEFLKRAKNEFKKRNFRSTTRNANLARQSAMDAKENFLTLRAKNSLSAIQLLISEADKLGADISDSQKALEIAEEMFANKNFDELESSLTNAEDLAKASLQAAKDRYLYDKLSAELSSVQDFIEETNKKGVDVGKSKEILQNSEQLLNDRKYEELEIQIKEAREVTSKALYQFQLSQANKSISSTETLISEAKEQGLDVTEAEELLKQAESLFQEEDFDALDNYLSEADKLTKARWNEFKAQQASEAISSTQSFLAESREQGIDVDEAQKLLLEAESLFQDEDYDAVEDYVKRAETIAKSSWDDYRAQLTLDTISRVENKFEEARAIGADVAETQKLIETAKTHFKQKEFDEAEEILKKSEELINTKFKELKRKETEAILVNTEKILDDARSIGANVSTAEKIFEEAKAMYNADELDISVINEFIKKAEIEVKEARERHINDTTQAAISSTETLIKELKHSGADVSEAEELLKQAEDMFKEDDFEAVDEIIKKAETAAEDSRVHFLTKKLSNDILITQRVIMDVKDMGGDVTEPLETLSLADKALKENDFGLVEEHIEKSKQILDDIKVKQVIKSAHKRVDDLRQSIFDLQKIGLDLNEAEALVNEAKTALDNDDYKEVNLKAIKAEDLIENARNTFYTTELITSIETIQKSVDETKDLGIDTKEARSYLDRAKQFADEGNFKEAKTILDQAQKSVDISRKDYYLSEWQKVLDETKKIIADTRKIGGDTSSTEKMISDAENLAKDGDYAQAKERLSESEQQIKEIYDTKMADLSVKSMENIIKVVDKTKELGIDLSHVDDMITKIQEAIDDKEYETVKNLTSKVEGHVENTRQEFIEKKIEEEITPIKEDLESAREIGAIVGDAEEYLDTANNSFKEGEFKKALKFIERAKNFVIRAREKVIKENHPQIDIQMVSTELQDNNWNKLTLLLENKGVIDAKDVRMIFTGDEMEFREPPTIPLIKVGQSMNVEVGVKPTVSGEMPMGLKTFYYRDFDDNEYIDEDEKQFNVKPQGSYSIENVFLTYQNGLLIAHETRKLKDDVQEDVFTSMLQAVQDFVKDSFYSKSKLDLNRLDFGDSKILIEKGNYVSLAVVIVAHEPSLLPLFMREIIREVEDTYLDVLEDWDGVMDELEGADEIIRRLLNVSAETEGDLGTLPGSYVSTIYNMSKNIKNMGGDPAEMEFLLESAIKSGSEGDFSSAWELLDQAEEKGKIFMTEAFVESSKIIENARETGLDVGETDKKLEEAQKQFREGNYEIANDIIQKATVTIGELQDKSQRVMYNEQITIFEESLNEMEGDGVDVSGPKAYLLMAQSAFDEGNYSKIENFLARGQDEFITLKNTHQQDQVSKSIDRAESILAKVRNIGVQDTSRMEEIIHMVERAKSARDQNDFETAVEYAKKARSTADSLIEESNERDAAKDAVDSATSIVSASKMAGVDVSSVEDLLSKSRSSYDKGDYLSTQSYAKDIQDVMDKLRQPFQTQIASNTIFSAQSLITEAKEFGAEVKEAEEILKEAKTLFESEEFEGAEVRANEAIESARLAKRRKQAQLMAEPLENIRSLITNVKSIGADVSDAQGFLQETEEALHKLELENAEEYLKRAENSAEESRDKYLMEIASEAITISEKQIDEAEQRGVDITDAKRMLTQAMEMFEDHEYIKAEQYASNASDLLEELEGQFGEKQAMDLYKNAGEMYSEIEALGADMSNAKVNLNLAEEAYGKQDFNMLRTHSQNTIDLLSELKKPHLEQIARDELAVAEQQLTAAKSFGVDISKAEELLDFAHRDAEQGFWAEVERKSKKASKISEEAKNLQYENQIKTEINSMRMSIIKYEGVGIDTTEVTQYLQKAEIALEGKNYANVGKFLKLIRDWVRKAKEQKNRDKVLEVINYSGALITYIKNNIKGITPDIRPAEEQLKLAKKAFKKKKYTAAEKSADMSKVIVENLKHPNLEQFLFVFKSLQTEEMLNSVRNIISDLRNKQVDTQEIKTFLKKAEFAFESDESYEKGKDYIIEAKLKAKDALKKYISKLASKSISIAHSQIISVKRMGVNVKEAEVYLEKAKIAYKAQEFLKSKMIADKVILALKKAKMKSKA